MKMPSQASAIVKDDRQRVGIVVTRHPDVEHPLVRDQHERAVDLLTGTIMMMHHQRHGPRQDVDCHPQVAQCILASCRDLDVIIIITKGLARSNSGQAALRRDAASNPRRALRSVQASYEISKTVIYFEARSLSWLLLDGLQSRGKGLDELEQLPGRIRGRRRQDARQLHHERRTTCLQEVTLLGVHAIVSLTGRRQVGRHHLRRDVDLAGPHVNVRTHKQSVEAELPGIEGAALAQGSRCFSRLSTATTRNLS